MAGRRYSKNKGNAVDQYYEKVAAELITQIEAGTAPWQKPWEPGLEPNTPINAATEKPYNGINRVWLDMSSPDPSDPRWCTYNQAQKLDAQVRKGEKGTKIQFWKFDKEQVKRDENGKPVKDSTGKSIKETVRLERPMVMISTVFHASQIDGLEKYQAPKVVQGDFERHERCEAMLANSQASIQHRSGDRAFYSPVTDSITLPEREQFRSPDAYYATALHELGHWTGHESRLNRDLAHDFGSEGYAKEELRAEISSYMLGQDLAIGHDPEQHASYVGSWVKVLKEDPKEIFAAARDAQKITTFVKEFDFEATKEITQSEEKDNTEAQITPESEIEATPESENANTDSDIFSGSDKSGDFVLENDESDDLVFESNEEDDLTFEPE